jgi:hypothetical protein
VGLGLRVTTRSTPGSPTGRAGDTGARGANEEGTHDVVQSVLRPSLERLGPRSGLSSTTVERCVRKPPRARSWLAGPRCGDASRDRRNRHRLVPASSGATVPLACEDRRLVGCARASFYGCRSRRATPRPREARSAGNGRVHEGRARAGPKGTVEQKVVDVRHRGGHTAMAVQGPSRALERASRGEGSRATEGASGRSPTRFRSRVREGGDLGRPHHGELARERGRRDGGGDRGARGTASTHRDGKTTPAAMLLSRNVLPAEASRTDVRQAIPQRAHAPTAHDAPGTHEARVLVRRREKAEVGPTHRVPRSSALRKENRTPRH